MSRSQSRAATVSARRRSRQLTTTTPEVPNRGPKRNLPAKCGALLLALLTHRHRPLIDRQQKTSGREASFEASHGGAFLLREPTLRSPRRAETAHLPHRTQTSTILTGPRTLSSRTCPSRATLRTDPGARADLRLKGKISSRPSTLLRVIVDGARLGRRPTVHPASAGRPTKYHTPWLSAKQGDYASFAARGRESRAHAR